MARSHGPLSGPARTPRAPVRFRLLVEQLEARNLLSAQVLGEALAHPALDGTPFGTSPSGTGLTPAQVRHAYGFDRISFNAGQIAADGRGGTIAVITAYSDPNIASDLATFDRTFGIADPPAFTIANPSGAPTAAPDPSWSLETALDVEWAHALAPGAGILLVQAPTASLGYLLNAVNYARNVPGVVTVSMSWGVSEFGVESYLDGYFTTPAGHVGGSALPGGITFVAASGDAGAFYGGTWPSASANVLAIGGSRLTTDAAGDYLGETGWTYSGAAISPYEARPFYQSPFQQSTQRTTPDVAYDGDPASGLAVYSSADFHGRSGWLTVGGTSAGAPQWSALIAVADQGRALEGIGSVDRLAYLLYNAPGAFHNITTGYNGFLAGPGYNLVTGLGSPYADRVVNFLTTGGLYTTLNTTGVLGTTSGTLPGVSSPFEAVNVGVGAPASGTSINTPGPLDAFALAGILGGLQPRHEVLPPTPPSNRAADDAYFAQAASALVATEARINPLTLWGTGGQEDATSPTDGDDLAQDTPY